MAVGHGKVQRRQSIRVHRAGVRTRFQQQLHHLRMALMRSDVQRRGSILVLRRNVRPFIQEDPHHLRTPMEYSKMQRRRSILHRRIDVVTLEIHEERGRHTHGDSQQRKLLRRALVVEDIEDIPHRHERQRDDTQEHCGLPQLQHSQRRPTTRGHIGDQSQRAPPDEARHQNVEVCGRLPVRDRPKGHHHPKARNRKDRRSHSEKAPIDSSLSRDRRVFVRSRLQQSPHHLRLTPGQSDTQQRGSFREQPLFLEILGRLDEQPRKEHEHGAHRLLPLRERRENHQSQKDRDDPPGVGRANNVSECNPVLRVLVRSRDIRPRIQ
mmetsp:Transcript_47880/g.109188  ORF Transcript_47880/g.109188 Transcript_47880/m.109188 type:complete len:323 (-) Transcript_47880:106-1074(-)